MNLLWPGPQARRTASKNWFGAAALLAYVDDVPAYETLCHTILQQFATNHTASVLDRMAKDCLILPPPADVVGAAGKMVDSVVQSNGVRCTFAPFRLVKGLAEYRRDRSQSALKWLDAATPENESNRELQVLAITAMAQMRLGETNKAETALAKANSLAASFPLKGPAANAQWPDRLMAQCLLREARTMVGSPVGAGSAGDGSK
jgi:hypothetical protein